MNDSSGDSDPQIHINGDPATEEEMKAVEFLAESLLAEVDPSFSNVRIFADNDDVVFSVSTVWEGEGNEDEAEARFSIINTANNDLLLTVAMDPSRNDTDVITNTDCDREDFIVLFSKLEETYSDNNELLQFLRRIRHSVSGTIFRDVIPNASSTGSVDYVAFSEAKKIADEQGHHSKRKVFEFPLSDDGQIVSISKHWDLDVPFGDSDDAGNLHIELSNQFTGEAAVYGNVDHEREVYHYNKYEASLLVFEVTEEDEQIQRLEDELGMNTPGKKDVREITEALTEASVMYALPED